MKLNHSAEIDAVQPIPAALIAEARLQAEGVHRRLIEVLAEKLNLPPEVFATRLGKTLHYPVLNMARLHELSPAFDVVPYNEAAQKECVAFRDEKGVLQLVFADPFNTDLSVWAEERITSPFTWHLAHAADIAAYLAVHEETMRAIDGILATEGGAQAARQTVEELSIKSISEDTSQVVKLVNSTIYDALKIAASDIHLETHASGMNIKYRIDGVLSNVGTVQGIETAEQ